MIRWLNLQWSDLRAGRPGRRFRQRYCMRQRRGRSTFAKPLALTGGLFLLLLGLALLPAPGPGFIVVLVGAALLAEESYWAAKVLDVIEAKAWRIVGVTRRMWRHASLAAKALSVLLATALAAFAGWATLLLIA